MLIVDPRAARVAGATLMPSTLSLIRNMFLDPEQRTCAIGIWATSFSVGARDRVRSSAACCSNISGGARSSCSAVPVMLLLLIVGPRLLPEYQSRSGPFDLVSAALSLVAVLAVIYGLKEIAASGVDGCRCPMLVGLVVGWSSFAASRRSRPADRPAAVPQPGLQRALDAEHAWPAIAFGIFLFIAQYLQLVLGLSPLEAGLWTVPSGRSRRARLLRSGARATFRPPLS